MTELHKVVAAFAAGAVTMTASTGDQAVVDAFDALRALIIRKLSEDSAVKAVEARPGSRLALAVLDERLLEAGLIDDPELLELAETLFVALKRSPAAYKVRDFGKEVEFVLRNHACGSIGAGSSAYINEIYIGDKIYTSGNINENSIDADYTVWYGTNRALNDPGNLNAGYSAKRDTLTHYGSCQVFVPKSHKIGSTGSPWWRRVLSGKDDRLRLRETQEISGDKYWSYLSGRLKEIDPSERHAVVFIHGYNVTFEEAALRAAQIGFDLSIRSGMAFFSWPSQGTLGGYLADAATIEASEEAITEFLVDFSERSGARTTHVLAHSMGNRGVLRAVDRIARKVRNRAKKRFGQIILAAADVDVDVFRQRCSAYAQVAKRTTLYVSTRDFAVEASRWLHDFPRAGLMPPVLVVPGIDTINVANVDLTQLGHGYVAEARSVLADIHHLIRQDTQPEHRFGLRAIETPDGLGRFWTIGA